MTTTAHWYFDVISPFAYLHSKQLHTLSSRLTIKPVPVLFAGLLNHWGQLGPAEIEPKRQFIFQQCAWRAEKLGIAFTMPPHHPFNPLYALRLIIALDATPDVISQVFDHIWSHGLALVDEYDRATLAEALGITLKQADELSDTPEVKQRLRENTQSATQRGVFGVPTMRIDHQLFWGDDSLPMLQDWLEGSFDLQSELMRKIAQTTASASR